MDAIAEKLLDALSMFWQSLDLEERRLLVAGLVYLGILFAMVPLERRRREREVEKTAERVVRMLSEARRP